MYECPITLRIKTTVVHVALVALATSPSSESLWALSTCKYNDAARVCCLSHGFILAALRLLHFYSL